MYEEVFSFISRAKDSGQYELANIATAFLISRVLDKEEGLTVSLETQDPEGVYPPEAYYDLVRIEEGELSACIPMPLLDVFCIACLFKAGMVVDERGEHVRKGDGEETLEQLHATMKETAGSQYSLWFEKARALLVDELTVKEDKPHQEPLYILEDDIDPLASAWALLAKLRGLPPVDFD